MSDSGRSSTPARREAGHPAPAPRRAAAPRLAFAAAATAALLIGAASPGIAGQPGERAGRGAHYVALGDSYSSGPGIPQQTDTVCGRSDRNYPSLVARAVGAEVFTDVTCAGADTTHMAGRQESAPPQLDALRPDTTLVTLGIGGNDLDLTGIITRCVLLGYLAPHGAPCKHSFTLLGTDEIGARINATAPKIDAVLKEIRTRSPRARVLLVGYPSLLPDDGTPCRATIPLADGDFGWVKDEEKHFDTVLAQQANVYDAEYVDTYGPSVGHDACQAPGVRWIEPADSAEGAGFHPNASGHRSMADAVLATLTR
ncbi:SGNH/GDSL hydrolase family protein [Streptomyces sp. ITFR-16]|uniref:SGNH/GDSL hydrolase family protein n=1 Tax=Streptomyces sp. ITFR-16 TaxID=3075198 RepID=UPI00288A1B20|nr:SGNH/GDSL hydrolase family protein [Streptomyces sp. ITFR-16]WNI21532.1 SGNH/GDSL hydrolase family protein [Streptomyces sp. ITFR-16]